MPQQVQAYNPSLADNLVGRGATQVDGKIVLVGQFIQWGNTTVNRIVRLNADGTIDTAFTANVGAAADAAISKVAIQADGKILVGGDFTTWNGAAAKYLVRLNSNGTRDTTFTTNISTIIDVPILVLAIQSDGKILAGGEAYDFLNNLSTRFVRLNADGTRDTAFTTNVGTGPLSGGGANSLAIQSDGKIVVGGSFATWNGTTVNYIVRLNADGTRDTPFTTNTGTGANSSVMTLAIQSDGKIVAGGFFTTWSGVTVNYIVRLNADGTRDTPFNTNTGTAGNSWISNLAVQSDGKIIIGGDFITWNGTTVNRIVRLNADGTRDTAFTTNTGTGANFGVNAIVVQSDGRIILGGSFTTWNGATNLRILALNSAGVLQTNFPSAWRSVTMPYTKVAGVWKPAKAVYNKVAGSWYSSFLQGGINDKGQLTVNMGTAANNGIYSIVVQSDGKILVGGAFTTWNGVAANYIVRLNADGTRDTAFTTNVGTAANNGIYSIAVQSDGKILVGGVFTTWNGVTVNRIVRLNADGTRDTAFTTNVGTAANNIIYSIAVQSDGKILVGGQFLIWNGAAGMGRITRLNADGTRDTAFNTNTGTAANDFINSIVVQSNSQILIVGAFTTWNGTTVNSIVRLNSNGTRDTAFTTNTGTAADDFIYSIAVQSDGKILVGGQFLTWNTATTTNGIVRLNTNGTRDTVFTTNTGTATNGLRVATIAVQSDGKILVGGNFLLWNGATVNRIVRLNADGTRDTVFTTNAGTATGNSTINAITIKSDSKILVGGVFTTWNGAAANYIAVIGGAQAL